MSNDLPSNFVQLTNSQKSFRKNLVFQNLNLTIGGGELVAILGLNGAGKTTLLRVLAGLLGLTEGSLEINGQALDRLSHEQRSLISYWPDMPPFLENVSVLENLGIWLNIYQQKNKEESEKALELLKLFHLIKYAKVSPSLLSRGERYKLALACYHASNAPLGLFDEPFASGMDMEGLSLMKTQLHQAVLAGKSVIYTTQLADYALNFATRILVLDAHQLSFDGSPERFREEQTKEGSLFEKFS